MTRTRQEIFDLAWNGLKAQGFAKSYDDSSDECRYRGPDGLRCAVGHLIQDADYDPAFEGMSANVRDVREAAGIELVDRFFADELQCCHDNAKGPADMRSRLEQFAATHSLTIPS